LNRLARGSASFGLAAVLLLAPSPGPIAAAPEAQSQGESSQQPPPAEEKPQQPVLPPEEAPPEQEQPPAPAADRPMVLRLQDADLQQFLNIIANEFKLNYVVDPAVKGTVNITTGGELKREDLLPILETVLKLNGAAAIKTGNFYRIVPLAQAPKMPLEISTDATGITLPADDRMMMQIIPLRYVSAADMSNVLAPYLSDGGSLVVHEAGNILLLADNSLNLKRLTDILVQFDSPLFAEQRVQLFPVENNVASSLVPELESIFAAYGLSESRSAVRFSAIDRINALLVVTADPSVYPEVEEWLARLDQPAAPSGVQTFVYRVENSEADYLARLLTSIHGLGGPSAPAERALVAGGAAGGETEIMARSPAGISIIPDPVNNSLIIQATPRLYSQIVSTLKEVDIIPRQVQIEARIYEVRLTGELAFGVSYFLQERSDTFKKGLVSFAAGQGLQASGGMLIGNTRELVGFLNASDNRQRVRIVSAPTVLATDNSEARIQVGSEVPILTSQGVISGVQAGADSVFTNTIQNRDTGIILTVTPRITATGLVSLHITQEISSTQAPPSAAIQSPSFLKRLISTRAVVQDGETIALGGLIEENATTTRNRIPLLGDIPGLGVLFGTTTRSKEKTELIVLLTPRIIPDVPAARAATKELREKLGGLRRSFKKDRILNPETH
jgi:general secretion pathway protein D